MKERSQAEIAEESLKATKAVCAKTISAHAADVDRNARFPAESLAELGSAGLLGLMVPRDHGGRQAGYQAFLQCVEAIAQSCASTAMIFVMHHTQYMMLVDHGTARQREFFLRPIVEGKSLFASGTTEAQVGGNADVCVSAKRRDGEDLLLTAKKPVVTAANHATWVCVTSRASEEAPGNLCSMLVMPGPKASAQVKGIGEWDCVGMRGTASSGLEFSDCRVPAWHQIGPEDASYVRATTMALVAFSGFSAVWMGIAQAALSAAIAHLTHRTHEFVRADSSPSGRTTVNKKLADYETVQRQVAEMQSRVQAARAMVLRTGQVIDSYRTGPAIPFTAEALSDIQDHLFACRLTCGETAVDVCRIALRICGVAALRRGHPLERHMRDALTAQVMAPGEDITKLFLGKKSLGFAPPAAPKG